MTLEEFLKKGDSAQGFDMKLDYANGALDRISDPIERFIVYKASAQYGSIYEVGANFSSKIRRKYPGLRFFDCDKSSLVLQIFRILWKDAIKEMEQSQISGELGDTMTSFQNILNMTIEKEDKEFPFFVKRIKNYSQNYCTALLASKEKDLLARLEKDRNLLKFAEYVHTIGNFIPIPDGVNCARAGKDGRHDCWDLALMKIKEWYDARGDKKEILRQFLHNAKDEVIESCEKWLNYYKTWDEFVEKNYLQDFVKDNKPILFCKGHSWENPRPENLSEFPKKVTELIAARSKRMVDALLKEKKEDK